MRLKTLRPMIYTKQVNETITFYETVLGFKCAARNDGWGWAALQRDEVEIMISTPLGESPEKFEKPVFSGSFYIDVENVDEIFDSVKDKAKLCYGIANYKHGMREFAIYDNNEYIIQFGQEINQQSEHPDIATNLGKKEPEPVRLKVEELVYNKIQLDIFGLSKSKTQERSYAIVLGHPNDKRRLPIVIGEFEAQSLAIALEKMAANRPLTHPLLLSMLKGTGNSVKEVVIYDIVEQIFHAKVVLTDYKEAWEVDARPSDAFTLAVMTGAPIYISDTVFEKHSMILDDQEAEKK